MIKSILVQLDAKPACQKRLTLVRELAKTYDAKVRGIYFSPVIHPLLRQETSPTEAEICNSSSTVIQSNKKRISQEKREISNKVRKVFDDPNALDWREICGLPNEDFISSCRHNDLTVVSNEFRVNNLVGKLNSSVATLAVECGGPILVIPESHESHFSAQRPVVAWDGSRASSRAISDAIPFIGDAKRITVISNAHKKKQISKLKDQQLIDYFACHNLDVDFVKVKHDCLNPINAIEGQIEHKKHDLLIMGAHGHSKVSELILGSTTRVMIANSRIPILLSH